MTIFLDTGDRVCGCLHARTEMALFSLRHRYVDIFVVVGVQVECNGDHNVPSHVFSMIEYFKWGKISRTFRPA